MVNAATAFAALLQLLVTSPLPASSLVVEVVNPRPFGYVIGDTVQRTIVVTTPQSLQRDALPGTGRVDAWLELRHVEVDEQRSGSSTRYSILLDYQIMNVAEDVKTIALPRVDLEFGGSTVATTEIAEAAEWPITVAPVTPEYVLARDGLEALRPDRSPELIATAQYRLRLWLYALLFAALVCYFAYHRYVAPMLSRKPFARAYRELLALSKTAEPDRFQASLRALHRAFDETTGGTVFAEGLDAFFAAHPRFLRLRSETEAFFALSQREFFGGGNAVRELDRVSLLSRRLAACEREGGRSRQAHDRS